MGLNEIILQIEYRTYVEKIFGTTSKESPYIPRIGEAVELLHHTYRVVDVQYNQFRQKVTIFCNKEKEK